MFKIWRIYGHENAVSKDKMRCWENFVWSIGLSLKKGKISSMLIHGLGHITKVEHFMEFGIKHAKTLQTLGHFFLS